MRSLLVLTLIPCFAGCVASRAYQPATSLGAGRVAMDATADVTPFDGSSGPTLVSSGSLGVTYGLSENVDARLALGTEGVTAEAKFVAFQNRSKGWALSVAPNASAGFWLVGSGYSLEAPVLLGYRPDDRTEFVLGAGPKYADLWIDAWGGNHLKEFSGVAAVSLHRWATNRSHVFLGAHVRMPLLKLDNLPTRPLMAGASVGVAFEFN